MKLNKLRRAPLSIYISTLCVLFTICLTCMVMQCFLVGHAVESIVSFQFHYDPDFSRGKIVHRGGGAVAGRFWTLATPPS